MTDNTMDDSDWTMAKRIRNAIWRLKYLEQKYVGGKIPRSWKKGYRKIDSFVIVCIDFGLVLVAPIILAYVGLIWQALLFAFFGRVTTARLRDRKIDRRMERIKEETMNEKARIDAWDRMNNRPPRKRY